MRYIIVSMLIAFSPVAVQAAPAISSVNGDMAHLQSVIISGSGFGSKAHATPLIWDDGESAVADSAPSGVSNAYSYVGYSNWQPQATRDGEAVPDTHQILYRSYPYTPQGESGVLTPIQAPHARSTKGLSGGHYYLPEMDGNNPARDVQVTVPNSTGTAGAFSTRWYARWRFRINPDMADCSPANEDNFKTSVVQSDIQAYGGATYNNDFIYMNYAVNYMPCEELDALRLYHSVDDIAGTCDWFNAQGEGTYATFGNAKNSWQVWEEIIVDEAVGGRRTSAINNQTVWTCTDIGEWFTTEAGQGIGSFSIGGYYRRSLTGYTGGEQSSDTHRMYDDIYVDDTLQRAVLANNATYANATIVEPQIPTAWADGSITVTVNQGALPDGDAYLFVFDADNAVSGAFGVRLNSEHKSATFTPGGPLSITFSGGQLSTTFGN